ncbi:unnamed protein product [Schistosoma margrebowiei]|uniref:Uncharacterized protein n=1 Tax=Schistosoma margrebowiei TaxID=48269 RepID=A0A3P8AEN1_9TREM|nr:unnamed protein product [Schistosoma margrebowiei]
MEDLHPFEIYLVVSHQNILIIFYYKFFEDVVYEINIRHQYNVKQFDHLPILDEHF